MLTRYREKRIISGQREEIFIYPEFAKAKKGSRKKKWRTTSAVQQRLNERNATRSLTRLINCNFGFGDYMVTLEYQDWNRPDNIEQVKADMRNFIRRLQYHYRKAGKTLKYIMVFEEGEYRGHLHIHLFLTSGIDRDKIEDLWGRGCANCKRLQPEYFEGLDKISGYVSKSPKGSKRWIPSKNLDKPVEKRPKKISRKRAMEFLEALKSNETAHKALDGARLLEVDELDNEVNGCLYAVVDILRVQKHNKNRKE